MISQHLENKRGFTAAEKWVIWGVFCLLVGLSTHRFTVFVGLLLLSLGFNRFIKRTKNANRIALGIIFSLFGILILFFSKSLF